MLVVHSSRGDVPGTQSSGEGFIFSPFQPATIINHAVIAGTQKPVPRRLSGNSIAISAHARARVINSADKNAREGGGEDRFPRIRRGNLTGTIAPLKLHRRGKAEEKRKGKEREERKREGRKEGGNAERSRNILSRNFKVHSIATRDPTQGRSLSQREQSAKGTTAQAVATLKRDRRDDGRPTEDTRTCNALGDPEALTSGRKSGGRERKSEKLENNPGVTHTCANSGGTRDFRVLRAARRTF